MRLNSLAYEQCIFYSTFDTWFVIIKIEATLKSINGNKRGRSVIIYRKDRTSRSNKRKLPIARCVFNNLAKNNENLVGSEKTNENQPH